MNFSGVIIAVLAFLSIGVFHPIVIKAEYHFSKKVWPVFLIAGLAFLAVSLFISNDLIIVSALLGAIGCSCLWSIKELFEQEERVKKGWFPANPKRKQDNKDK